MQQENDQETGTLNAFSFGSSKKEEKKKEDLHTKSIVFECNICFDVVSSPVVTYCGHLYCWPCLYQWLEKRSECPVCKAGVSEEKVIPVYARGSDSVDPRSNKMEGIPSRPQGQRLDPAQLRRRRPFSFGSGFSSISPTLSFFPSHFGVPLMGTTIGGTPVSDNNIGSMFGGQNTPMTPIQARQQMQQAFLSRLLLIVGSLVLLALLTF